MKAAGALRATAPPLLAWLAALASLWLVAALTSASPTSPATWAHWDAGHYVSIAEHGYDAHRCRPGEYVPGAVWCGNAAWFPAYPWAVAAVHATGVPVVTAGVAVSWCFAALVLVLLWLGFVRSLPRSAALLALLYAAFAPGYVYEFAVFPMSMFVAACVTCFLLLRARRWPAAAGAAFVAGLTYPIGVLALPLVGLVYVGRATHRVASTVLVAAAPLVAFGCVLLVQRLQTGRWTAFFDVQQHYDHGLHSPFATTWTYVADMWRAGSPAALSAAPYWQTLLVTVVVLLVVVLGRGEPVLLLWAVAAWAVPLTQANVSVWRSQDALLPIAPRVGTLPRPLTAVIAAAAVAVGLASARLYFEGALV